MSGIVLVPAEEWGDQGVEFLYELLITRPAEANISHKVVPEFADHAAFVASVPYEGWWLIVTDVPVGACYITKMGEIGIQISRAHQRKGYARTALNTLIEMHKGRRLLANVAPGNDPSRKLFEGFGFRLIQHTFSLEP